MTDLDKAFEAKLAEKQGATTAAPMEQIDPETGELITTDLAVAPVTLTNTDFDWDALEEAEEGYSLQPVYWSPTAPDQVSRGIYQGQTTISKNEKDGQKQIPVVLWLTRDGLLMNGGVSFMSNFDSMEVGQPVLIRYKGKKKTQSGNSINDFEVKTLVAKK
jgi:hypothetical protein